MNENNGSSRLSSSVRAAANKKGESPGKCRNCTGKVGLALFPVCFAPAPSYMDKWLSDDAVAVAQLARLGRRLNASDGSATWYYLRTLPTGYLYIYKSDNTWDAYVVGVDGMFNRMPVDALPDQPDEVLLSSCSREGHSNIKPRFITVDSSLDKIWIAFSQHRWSSEVVKAYEENSDGRRDSRMTQLMVQEAASGNVGMGSGVSFGMLATAESLRGVADFTPSEFQARLHEFVPRAVLNLSASCDSLVSEMATASSATPVKTGVALVIPDPVGLADDHNALRSMVRRRADDWRAGGQRLDGLGADPLRAWKRQSATHVAYVETWARQRADWEGKQTAESIRRGAQQFRDQGAFLVTEREFQRKHGKAVAEPLKKKNGLNPYHRARWIPSIDPVTNRLRMTTSKIAETGDPRDYDPNWKSEPLGNIEYSEEYIVANGKYHGSALAKEKLERYRERLDVGALQQFNLQYVVDEDDWESAVKKVDEDFAKFSSSPWSEIVCKYDFNSALPKAAASQLDIKNSVYNSVARLRAVECFYGGGAASAASFELLDKFFKLDVSDENNWFAGALLSGFDLLESAKSPGNAGTVYTAILSGALLPQAWWQEFKRYQQSAVASVESLVLSMQQVASENRAKALKPAAGKGVSQAVGALEEIARKEIVWVRAAALWDFIDTGKQHYSINVKMTVGSYLDAVANGDATASGVFELNGRKVGDRTASRRANADSRKLLANLQKRPEFQADMTVPLIVERATLERARGKQGVTQLYNIGQSSPVVELPADVAERLVQGNTILRQHGWKGFANREVGFSAFAIFFSVRQFWDAWAKLGSTSGFNYADASVNVMGGLAGTFGGAMEISAFAYQAASRQSPPLGTSLLAVNVNRALMLRFLAGVSTGVGALMSGFSAFISSFRADAQGQIEAAHNYRTAGVLLSVSGGALIGGSFVTWKAALAARVGQQVALRVLGGVALRTSIGALVGASMTGVGVVLLIVGIAWALYAASLEHDENERFLDRSFFGKHERTEGRFGGAEIDDKDAWVAGGLNDEILGLGALALGITATIENWQDNLLSSDVIFATISVGDLKVDEQEVKYSLEGYESMPDMGKGLAPAGARVVSSDASPLVFEEIPDGGGHKAKIESPIPGKFRVVRLVYSLHSRKSNEIMARGEVWEKD